MWWGMAYRSNAICVFLDKQVSLYSLKSSAGLYFYRVANESPLVVFSGLLKKKDVVIRDNRFSPVIVMSFRKSDKFLTYLIRKTQFLLVNTFGLEKSGRGVTGVYLYWVNFLFNSGWGGCLA